jgi:hypothetical protein
MADNQAHFAFGQFNNHVMQKLFREAVDIRSDLVKQQDGRFTTQYSQDTDHPLACSLCSDEAQTESAFPFPKFALEN